MDHHTQGKGLPATLDNILAQPRYHLVVRAGTEEVVWGPGTSALRHFYESLSTTNDLLTEALASMREDVGASTRARAAEVFGRLNWLESEVFTLMHNMDYEAFQATLARGEVYVQQ